MFSQMLKNVRVKTPLVHNITNYVTVNDCANIILAAGGSPIMADDINEVEDITSICGALVINMGTLNERTIASMLAAGKRANELGLPVVFDPVGAGASRLRNETALMLVENIRFSVIRGNISEILFIATGGGNTQGVDASDADRATSGGIDGAVKLAQDLSKRTGAVIVITGAVDVVAKTERVYIIRNGHPMMGKITGSGCMLTAVLGAYAAANPDSLLDAAAAGVCAMGLCGERAFELTQKAGGGTGTFRTHLIDCMSNLDANALEAGARYDIL